MTKYFYLLFILPLISSIYRPMSDQKFKFDSDVCYYYNYNDKVEYVKPCKKGKVCIPIDDYDDDIYKCQDNDDDISLLKLGEKNCKYDEQCDSNLKCLEGVCTINVNSTYHEPYEKGRYLFCPKDYVPGRNNTSRQFQCQNKTEFNHTSKCYFKNLTTYQEYYYAPEFKKVCGEIIISTSEEYFEIKEINTNKIGSLSAGTFVDNMTACESGFAIEYCLDGNYECSNTSNTTSTGLKCIDVKEINLLNDCIIKYNDGKEELIINLDFDRQYCSEIKVKLEMFKKYVDKMSKCDDVKLYDDEPLTCRNKDLRKYMYFYEHPDEYILYKDEDDIIDYLVQSAYSSSYYLAFAKLSILLILFLL